LDLAFDTLELRFICEDEEYAINKIGPEVAKNLHHRLAEIRVAKSIDDILLGNPRIIESEELEELLIMDISFDFIVVFCANHQIIPVDAKNRISWNKVSRIKVLQIERKK